MAFEGRQPDSRRHQSWHSLILCERLYSSSLKHFYQNGMCERAAEICLHSRQFSRVEFFLSSDEDAPMLIIIKRNMQYTSAEVLWTCDPKLSNITMYHHQSSLGFHTTEHKQWRIRSQCLKKLNFNQKHLLITNTHPFATAHTCDLITHAQGSTAELVNHRFYVYVWGSPSCVRYHVWKSTPHLSGKP